MGNDSLLNNTQLECEGSEFPILEVSNLLMISSVISIILELLLIMSSALANGMLLHIYVKAEKTFYTVLLIGIFICHIATGILIIPSNIALQINVLARQCVTILEDVSSGIQGTVIFILFLLMTVLGIERCIAMLHLSKQRNVVGIKKPKFVVLACFTSSIIFMALHKLGAVGEKLFHVLALIVSLLCTVVISTSYILVCHSMLRYRRQIHDLVENLPDDEAERKKNKEKHRCVTVVIVCATTIGVFLLRFVSSVLENVWGDKHPDWMYISEVWIDMLVHSQAVTDPLVIILRNTQLRRQIRAILRRKEFPSSESSTS